MKTARRPSSERSKHTFRRSHSHAFRLFAALAVLALSALPLQISSISSVEAEAFRFVNGWPDFIHPAMWLVMQGGNLLAAALAALVSMAARRIRLSLDLLVAGGGSWLLAKVVKEYFNRGRPAAFLNDVVLRDAPFVGHGFVSGHAATAVALATVASPYLPRGAKAVIWAAAALVCIARVYVGAHLPLDVIGGAAMGWGIGSLVHVLLGAPHPGVHHAHRG
jgi:membrane-associated phospholipid phosphatase